MQNFTDLAVSLDATGIFDIELDAVNRDAGTSGGLYDAILISLFSDRRARKDEVAEPMKRRGWIGDLVSDVPGDLHGSGLWFFMQSRLTDSVAAGIEAEARNCLQWMIDERLCSSVAAKVVRDPQTRTITLNITLGFVKGSVQQHAFVLASATQNGLLINT